MEKKANNHVIMIVDDNLINLKLTKLMLSLEGYQLYTALNAQELFAQLETLKPDMILMDIQLPDMDGLEITRQLKRSDEHKNIIIVAITAYAMHGDEKKALEAGCDAYISKPIEREQLLARIADYLKRE